MKQHRYRLAHCLLPLLGAALLSTTGFAGAQEPPTSESQPENVTNYAASDKQNYEFVSYGTLAWRENNLVAPRFRSDVATSDWVIRLLAYNRARVTRLRPYLKIAPAWSSSSFPPENTLTYGLGVEVRPLAQTRLRPEWDFLTRLRFYTEYLGQSFFKRANTHDRPRQDWALGFDIWREYGFVDPNRRLKDDRIWGELFLGGAFVGTNFLRKDYNAVRFGLNAKVGGRLGSRKTPLMPYAYLDLNTTSRYADDLLDNRLLGGIGLRTEWRFNQNDKVILFAEFRGVLDYLKSRPLFNNVPPREWRVGLTFQVSRY